jgi:nucleoside-diphosphate-sugar epimerase
MRIFVTGASGFVGSAVVQRLIENGHAVTGLARSEEGAKKVEGLGAEALRGVLEDHEALRRAAAASEGVIHCGFNHDFSRFRETCANEKLVIEALAEALAEGERPLIVTSGVAIPNGGVPLTEDAPVPGTSHNPRIITEHTVLVMRDLGRDVRVVRLPIVHGDGDHGFIVEAINRARAKGRSAYVGDGLNRWPAGHIHDVAETYVAALERGSRNGTYHAVGDTGVAFKDIAQVIGQRLGLPVVSIAASDAAEHFGWLAAFAGNDAIASSDKTTEQLGVRFTQPRLLADLANSTHYFTALAA